MRRKTVPPPRRRPLCLPMTVQFAGEEATTSRVDANLRRAHHRQAVDGPWAISTSKWTFEPEGQGHPRALRHRLQDLQPVIAAAAAADFADEAGQIHGGVLDEADSPVESESSEDCSRESPHAPASRGGGADCGTIRLGSPSARASGFQQGRAANLVARPVRIEVLLPGAASLLRARRQSDETNGFSSVPPSRTGNCR